MGLSGYESDWRDSTRPYDRFAARGGQPARPARLQQPVRARRSPRRKTAPSTPTMFSPPPRASAPAGDLPTAVVPTRRPAADDREGDRRARDRWGMTRQTFFVRCGGWDHHDEVIANQAACCRRSKRSGRRFFTHAVALGMENKVTLFHCVRFRPHAHLERHAAPTMPGAATTSSSAAACVANGFSADTRRSTRQSARCRPRPADSHHVGGRVISQSLRSGSGVSEASLPLVLPNISAFTIRRQPDPVGFLA